MTTNHTPTCKDEGTIQARTGESPEASFRAEETPARLIPAEMTPAQMERMAFNLCDEFGAGFVEANRPFALAVYAEAYAMGAPLSTAPTATVGPGERVRHVKRGTEYEVLGEAEAQVSYNQLPTCSKDTRPIWDGDRLTVYRGSDGQLWCRFTDEFRDGRFQTISQAPAEQAPAGEVRTGLGVSLEAIRRLLGDLAYHHDVAPETKRVFQDAAYALGDHRDEAEAIMADAPGRWIAWEETEADSDPSDIDCGYSTSWMVGWSHLGARDEDHIICADTEAEARLLAANLNRLLTSRSTPTDPHPKAVGPVGEEGLREALTFSTQFHRDAVARMVGSDSDGEMLARVVSDASLLHAALGTGPAISFAPKVVADVRAAIASQPTPSPRDGGVREALDGLYRAVSRLEPADGLEIPAFATPDELANSLGLGSALSASGSPGPGEALDIRPQFGCPTAEPSIRMLIHAYYARHFSAAQANEMTKRYLATLFAPGSAGPGEHIQHVKSGGWYEVLTRDAQVQTSEPLADHAFVAVYRNVITGATWVQPISEMDDGRFRPAPASPHPAREPNTGDTGEPGRPIEEAPCDGTPIIGWGAPSSRYPDEREWRETRWTLYGEGSPAYAAHKAGTGPEGYWDWSEPQNNWGASWKPTRFIPVPTPATPAETRGPAEGAR